MTPALYTLEEVADLLKSGDITRVAKRRLVTNLLNKHHIPRIKAGMSTKITESAYLLLVEKIQWESNSSKSKAQKTGTSAAPSAESAFIEVARLTA